MKKWPSSHRRNILFILTSLIVSCSQKTTVPFIGVSNKVGYSLKKEILEKQVDELFSNYRKKGMPGASIAIIKNGHVIYSKGYGYANIEYDIPNSANTPFHVASISKQFTAYAIATLIDQGKLSMNDDIRMYLPDLPDYGSKITVQHLVHHTSGLKDQWNLIALAGWRSGDVITDDQIMKIILSQQSINFKPGEEFLYSNTNYTLLAKIVEKVTGKTFSNWTMENIFEALGMKNTFFNDDYEKVIKNSAYSYTGQKGEYKKSILNSSIVGPSGLITTADDLAIWSVTFNSPMPGSKSVMELMGGLGSLNNGEKTVYAFGQVKTHYKGLNLLYHDGADAGYRTYLGRFPDQGFAVVVLANTDLIDPERIAMKITDIYLADDFKDKSGREELKLKDNIEDLKSMPAPNFLLEEYEGRYKIGENLVFHIWNEENQLRGQITGKNDIHELKSKSKSIFEIPTLNASVLFRRNEENIVTQIELSLRNDGKVFIAKKLEQFNPAKVDLSEYEGKYRSEELSTVYDLETSNGKIIARNFRIGDIELTLTEPDYFIGNQWFFKNVEVVRDADKRISGIKVSNGRARNIWFKSVY